MTVLGLDVSVEGAVEREPGSGKADYVVQKGRSATIRAKLSQGFAKLRVTLEDNAALVLKASSARQSSLDIDCELAGRYSSAEITGICSSSGSDLQKSSINVRHSAPDSRSRVVSRGVAWDSSSVELSGLAKIEKAAPGSVSRVECRALVLGEGARARADPLLEILNNDVDCSHSASVHELDREKVFYLQTRGLSREEAEKFIVDAFLTA